MVEEIIIYWRGPFTYDEVIAEEGYDDDERIYAIAHEPPVNKSKTKYLGIAHHQNIGKRLKGDHSGDEWIYEQYGVRRIRYYLGKVLLKRGQRKSEYRLKDVEAAMIYFHYNFENIVSANVSNRSSYLGRDLRIMNRGDVPPAIVDFENIGEEWYQI